MKKILISILVLALAGGAIGYYLYNKPVASLSKKKPELDITATQMHIDYEENETAADAKYLGKLVQVSGTIADIITEGDQQKVVLFTGSPMATVICEIEKGQEAVTLSKGQEARIKGKCTGFQSVAGFGDIILVQSTIVK